MNHQYCNLRQKGLNKPDSAIDIRIGLLESKGLLEWLGNFGKELTTILVNLANIGIASRVQGMSQRIFRAIDSINCSSQIKITRNQCVLEIRKKTTGTRIIALFNIVWKSFSLYFLGNGCPEREAKGQEIQILFHLK